ncbi:alpha/beta fold hydrolase [Luteipulveratus mongoliensis]|uniref:AB hydrolase-1 domain-containing protein n=1 Tax=Luteipulveratus mongoliensis TaxID=571913 RepID=A0A0K1JDG9_9MICO|nr:alpha/beta fold hydrolase [Luteipulveratus mongoliensis]AKU14650.1 hypothetical protein VV02_00150 [Luteipulveratus mongoliensis]
MRRRTVIAAALAVPLNLAGGMACAATPSPGRTAATPAAASGPVLEGQAPCAGIEGFSCSTLRVPLDHGRRTPGSLDLKVAAANNVNAPRGVLLVLSGGPGQPGVSLVNRVRTYFDPKVLQDYRMVMIDQRGTGPDGINCADLQAATGGSDFLTPKREDVISCATQIGRTRNFYRTPDTVNDLELLRRALGVRRMAVDGVSYGTYTAEHYTLRYPSRVSALVLDSVVPHRGFDPFSADGMAATKRVLTDTCRKSTTCTTDPVADLAWLVRHGEIDGQRINGTELLDALGVMSLSSVNPTFEGIPGVLHKARTGDTAPLKNLLEQTSSVGAPHDQMSAGLHMATLCADLRFPWGDSATPVARRQAPLDRAVQRLNSKDLYPYDKATARALAPVEGCLNWPVSRPSEQPRAQTLRPPTLIVHGRNDLFCPVEWAYEEKRYAPRGKVVVIDGIGHSVQGSPTNPTARNEVRNFLNAR